MTVKTVTASSVSCSTNSTVKIYIHVSIKSVLPTNGNEFISLESDSQDRSWQGELKDELVLLVVVDHDRVLGEHWAIATGNHCNHIRPVKTT